jgi:hypothetical protein
VSEVDRLSNSGLYPALPVPGRQRDKDKSSGKPPRDPRAAHPDSTAPDAHPDAPRLPNSHIDEYA